MTIDTSREAVERLLDGATPGPWEALSGGNHRIVASYMCINGLSALFTLVTVDNPDDAERGYTDDAYNPDTAKANARFIAAARELVPALLARAEAAEAKIENAGQAMAETQPSWEYRCHAIVAALGMDFGGPTPEGIPEEHTWYARNLKRANAERDAAVLEAHQCKAERDAALAEVARLSHAHATERKLADDLAKALDYARGGIACGASEALAAHAARRKE